MRYLTVLLAVAYPALTLAEEFKDLAVSKGEWVNGYFNLHLDGTRGGIDIVCALYAKDGMLIDSTITYTDNLATKVIFPGIAEGIVHSWKCVENE